MPWRAPAWLHPDFGLLYSRLWEGSYMNPSLSMGLQCLRDTYTQRAEEVPTVMATFPDVLSVSRSSSCHHGNMPKTPSRRSKSTWRPVRSQAQAVVVPSTVATAV